VPLPSRGPAAYTTNHTSTGMELSRDHLRGPSQKDLDCYQPVSAWSGVMFPNRRRRNFPSQVGWQNTGKRRPPSLDASRFLLAPPPPTRSHRTACSSRLSGLSMQLRVTSSSPRSSEIRARKTRPGVVQTGLHPPEGDSSSLPPALPSPSRGCRSTSSILRAPHSRAGWLGPQHIGVLCICPTPHQRNALGCEQVCGKTRYSIVPAGPLGRGHRRTGHPQGDREPDASRR